MSASRTGCGCNAGCHSRREFLLRGGAAVTVMAFGAIPGFASVGEPASLVRADYPRRKVGSLSVLAAGRPVEFSYPHSDIVNLLVRLGVPAAGGVGPRGDVVAFNQRCTHLGASLRGTYDAERQLLGPCPAHLTVFDLTRHGFVLSGHATESLPQIVLETDGDDIYAAGVMGLVFGETGEYEA